MRRLKTLLGFLIVLLLLGLLALYWFMPFGSIEFIPSSGNSNFTINSSFPSEMQFYPNLRYASPGISYNIDPNLCTIKKQDDMRRAFGIIQNLTVLEFHESNSNPDIMVTCDSKVVVNKDYFVAGEGGPVNIKESGDFHVITNGQILLLKESSCANPNVAIHELLHALGFNHSANENNIMYPVTTCSETIGEDIPALINKIYSVPSFADLAFENVSATAHGRYLDTNITVANNGLVKSGSAVLIMSANGNEINREAISPLDIGTGITFFFRNIKLQDTNVTELEYNLQTDFSEIDRSNNQIKLKIKE